MRFKKSLSLQEPQAGFALPIAIGMGLIAVLVGLTAILRAQNDRVDAINSGFATESRLAAESGITQIQSFMNRYRMVANFNACNNDNWASNGTCNDSGSALTDASWGNPSLIPNLNAVCGTGTLSQSRSAVANWTSNTWRPVDPSSTPDLSLGEYRLVNYDPNGTLTVEGISKRNQPGESRSLLVAQLPVFDIGQERVAGLWVNSSISGNPAVDTDIVASCSSSASVSPTSGNALIRTQMSMPVAPAQPAVGTGVYSLANISTLPGDNTTVSNGGTTTYITGKKLPRLISNGNGTTVDDVPDSLGVYNYIVSDLDDSFEIVPGTAVNIWIDQSSIDLTNKRIVNPCNAPGATLTCGPFDVRVYGSGSSINLNAGTALCDVFFHLPNHNLNFASSGATSLDCGDNRQNTSVFWVNSWSGADGSNNLLAPRATWSQALSSTSISVPPPRIGQLEVLEPDS